METTSSMRFFTILTPPDARRHTAATFGGDSDADADHTHHSVDDHEHENANTQCGSA